MTTSPTRQRRKRARSDRLLEILKTVDNWNEAVRQLMAEETEGTDDSEDIRATSIQDK